MALAVALLFDNETETAVRNVWEVVRATTASSFMFDQGMPPHITLAIWDEADGEALRTAFDGFRAGPFDVTLASVGSFPGDEGVAFLAPVVTAGLLDLHRRWHEVHGGGNVHYRPGHWVPHATVGFQLAGVHVKEALAVARPALPIRGRFESMELVEFVRSTATPVTEIARRAL